MSAAKNLVRFARSRVGPYGTNQHIKVVAWCRKAQHANVRTEDLRSCQYPNELIFSSLSWLAALGKI